MSYWAERRAPTLDPATLQRLPADIPRWKIAYWQIQHELMRRYIVPALDAAGAVPRRGRILEIGAGEAGCLAALHEATGLSADGVELSPGRTDLARRINAVLSPRLRLLSGDITDPSTLADLHPPYALIVLRDVIEHIAERDRALANCRDLLEPRAVVLVTFPPYFSPYGAHQQILSRRWLRLPWLQLLPFFPQLLEWGEPVEGKRREVRSIRACSCTLGRFEASAARSGLEIVLRRHYLVRPIFRIRYGVPVIRGSVPSRIPGLRELVTTGAWYFLRRSRDARDRQSERS